MKWIKFFLLILFILTTSGCSSKLSCKKETKNEIIKITALFESDQPINLTWEKTLLFSSSDAYIDMSLLEEKQRYSVLDNISGIIYKIDESDRKNSVTVKIDVDYKTYNDNSPIEIPIKKDTLENNVIFLEQNGYICK